MIEKIFIGIFIIGYFILLPFPFYSPFAYILGDKKDHCFVNRWMVLSLGLIFIGGIGWFFSRG